MTVSALLISGMVGAGSASAAQDRYNCGDFATQPEAQKVLDSTPGDPHDLDRDGDGIACESLPGGPGGEPGTDPTTTKPERTTTDAPKETTTRQAPEDKNCPDFPNQAAAQAVLNADPSDPHRLDGDDDGYACESHFGEPEQRQVEVRPVGGVDTGGGAGKDDTALVALGGLVLIGAGAGVALVVRRRAHAGNR
ncbi:excalibur calcium-binding domain-containing protein [Amycolatopsis cihanbeyliensis]|uniref:excalibur calcium-binding domain-containing protein n=1 Tax=Amycolatopsis cihanbeyliensis TaxID=1128664 RepID=UPI001FE8DB3E|nr:excalibur calcium-binding domain-containing protein [Amycolatopsis cihanbeyliensis]